VNIQVKEGFLHVFHARLSCTSIGLLGKGKVERRVELEGIERVFGEVWRRVSILYMRKMCLMVRNFNVREYEEMKSISTEKGGMWWRECVWGGRMILDYGFEFEFKRRVVG